MESKEKMPPNPVSIFSAGLSVDLSLRQQWVFAEYHLLLPSITTLKGKMRQSPVTAAMVDVVALEGIMANLSLLH